MTQFVFGILAVFLTGCSVNLPECPSVTDSSNSANELRLLINSHDKTYSAILVCGDSNPKLVGKFQQCISSNESVQSLFASCPGNGPTTNSPVSGQNSVTSTSSPQVWTTKTSNNQQTTIQQVTSPPTTQQVMTEPLTTEAPVAEIYTTIPETESPQTETPNPDVIPLKRGRHSRRPMTH